MTDTNSATPAGEQAAPLVASFDWNPLKEDPDERQQFEWGVKVCGGTLAHIAQALKMFSIANPHGSFGAQCAIMANEIAKIPAILATAAAVREPEPALGNPAAPSSLSAQGRAPCSEPRATGGSELPARAGDAVSEFLSEGGYLSHPKVRPYRGTEYGDSQAAWHRDYVEALCRTVLDLLASTPAAPLQADLSLSQIDVAARAYASSYASPHHITFTVEGLRSLVAAIGQAQGERG